MATRKQMAAVKHLVFHSQNATKITKQVCALLLDRSRGLTRSVYVNLEPQDGWTPGELTDLIRGMHDIHSSNGITHCHSIMYATGSPFQFYYLSNPSGGCTVLLGKIASRPEKDSFKVRASRKILADINLNKPGLYPLLERNRFGD